VSDPSGKIHAQIEGRMEFEAPESKTFVTTSEEGSAIVRHLALKPLIASEINAARGKDRHDSAITPANYTLELIGEDEARSHPCYVLRASPKRADKYLFEGKVWIDKQDIAVARIFPPAASPASAHAITGRTMPIRMQNVGIRHQIRRMSASASDESQVAPARGAGTKPASKIISRSKSGNRIWASACLSSASKAKGGGKHEKSTTDCFVPRSVWVRLCAKRIPHRSDRVGTHSKGSQPDAGGAAKG
jgi:hypothetical protein